MKILLIGPFLSMSGYGNHSRQVLEYVFEKFKNEEIYCSVTNWGNTNWNLNKDFMSDSVYDRVIDNFIPEDELDKIVEGHPPKNSRYFDVSYQICFPEEWNHNVAKKNIGFFAGIETTLCCEKWLDKISLMDNVVVPSKHALNSVNRAIEYFCYSASKFNVCVIPEWYYDDFLSKSSSNTCFIEEVKTENNVLIVGQLNNIDPETDRKNILKTLEATVNALNESKDWGIILKMFTENNSIVDFYKTKKILKTYLDLTFENKDNIPKIYLLHGNMKNKEIKDMYFNKKVSCLVSGTKGEGFGLTFLEAAAAGIPIVAPKWSAYDEFLDYYLGVDYKLCKIPAKLYDNKNKFKIYSNIWVEESKWAEFEIDSMIKSIKKVIFKDYNKELVLSQKKSILNKYSKNAIMKIYSKQLGR